VKQTPRDWLTTLTCFFAVSAIFLNLVCLTGSSTRESASILDGDPSRLPPRGPTAPALAPPPAADAPSESADASCRVPILLLLPRRKIGALR
jgi:hypothetical protein